MAEMLQLRSPSSKNRGQLIKKVEILVESCFKKNTEHLKFLKNAHGNLGHQNKNFHQDATKFLANRFVSLNLSDLPKRVEKRTKTPPFHSGAIVTGCSKEGPSMPMPGFFSVFTLIYIYIYRIYIYICVYLIDM